jgi:hypothetical protein
MPKTDIEAPRLVQLRREIAEATLTKSRTDSVDPKRAFPQTENDDPKRTKLRREIEEPK